MKLQPYLFLLMVIGLALTVFLTVLLASNPFRRGQPQPLMLAITDWPRDQAFAFVDLLQLDTRYHSQQSPNYGLPDGHVPVVSYLAASIISRFGQTIGGLFLGHTQAGVFTAHTEQIVVSLVAQIAVAMDNARLFAAAQREISERKQAETRLNASLAEKGALLKEIHLQITIVDIAMGLDTAIPCGLIINELVSNALKYAFAPQQDGEICVGLVRKQPKQLCLTVSDNGCGLPPTVDFRNIDSFGLQLVNLLTAQLDGTIELDGNGGAAFKITIRVA